MNHGEAEFIAQAREGLEQHLAHTPAHVASRLSAARHKALDSRARRRQPLWFPVMATAALVAVVVSGTWFAQAPAPQAVMLSGLEQHVGDFDMLAQGDDLELYAEMDFYLWLEQREL